MGADHQPVPAGRGRLAPEVGQVEQPAALGVGKQFNPVRENQRGLRYESAGRGAGHGSLQKGPAITEQAVRCGRHPITPR